MTTLSNTELENRRPVWSTLSELFLDTTPDARKIERIANALARSPFTLDERERGLLVGSLPGVSGQLGFDCRRVERV